MQQPDQDIQHELKVYAITTIVIAIVVTAVIISIAEYEYGTQ